MRILIWKGSTLSVPKYYQKFLNIILLWKAINFLLLICFELLATLRDNIDTIKKLAITNIAMEINSMEWLWNWVWRFWIYAFTKFFRFISFLHKLCALAHGKVHSLIGGAKIQPPPHVSPRERRERWAQFSFHTQTDRTIVTLSTEVGG